MPAFRHRFLVLGLTLALLGAGCKGSPTLPQAPQIPNTGSTLFNIAIQGAPEALSAGDEVQLRAFGEDELGMPLDEVEVDWKSSDPGVATVSADGTVKAIKSGRVIITATSQNPPRETTTDLQIVGPGEAPPPGDAGYPDIPAGDGWGYVPPSGNGAPTQGGNSAPQGVNLVVYPETPRVLVGQTLRLMAYQGPAGWETPGAAVWRSLDPSVATVDEAGVVRALKAGTVTIVATSVAYPGLRREVRLSVAEPVASREVRGITIRPSSVTMNVGETFWLLAEVPTWSGGYDPNIRWISADPSIVQVSETGQVTARAPGRTTITAIAATYKAGELSATIPVEVRNAATSSMLRFH